MLYSIVPTEMISYFAETNENTEYAWLLLNISWLRRNFTLFRVLMQIVGIIILNQELNEDNDGIAIMQAGTMLVFVCIFYASILAYAICPSFTAYGDNGEY